MFRIVGWNERYETSESRKRKRLDWVAVPNQWDSRAYLAITRLPDAAAILGVWMLLLEVASRMPERGVLVEDGIPLTIMDIAAKVRLPEKVIDRASAVLSSSDVGWLALCQESADTPADHAGVPACHAENLPLPNHTLPDLTRPHKATAPRSRTRCAPSYPADFEAWWNAYRVIGNPGGKLPALEEWRKLPEDDRASMLDRTRAYIGRRAAASARGVHVPYAPHGATYINQRRWDDTFGADATDTARGGR